MFCTSIFTSVGEKQLYNFKKSYFLSTFSSYLFDLQLSCKIENKTLIHIHKLIFTWHEKTRQN